MPKLTVHLREGFFQTSVVIYIDGQERFNSESVTTRMQISYAEKLDFEVTAGRIEVEIEFPTLRRSIRETINVQEEMHVGVDLDENGFAIISVREEPFYDM